MKRLLLVATGGTIASSTSAEGHTPTFDADALLHQISEIKDLCDIEGLTIDEYRQHQHDPVSNETDRCDHL